VCHLGAKGCHTLIRLLPLQQPCVTVPISAVLRPEPAQAPEAILFGSWAFWWCLSLVLVAFCKINGSQGLEFIFYCVLFSNISFQGCKYSEQVQYKPNMPTRCSWCDRVLHRPLMRRTLAACLHRVAADSPPYQQIRSPPLSGTTPTYVRR